MTLNASGQYVPLSRGTAEDGSSFKADAWGLSEGISLERYNEFGAAPLNPANQEFLQQQNFLEILTNGNLRATPSGFLVLDAVVADLAADQF